MRVFINFIQLSLILCSSSLIAQAPQISATHAAPLKPRIIVLTDISTWEPDDHESLIRLMVHADMFEIEGIIITTGWSMDNVNEHMQFKDIATGVIDAYEKDLPRLLKRSNQSGFTHDNDQQEIGYWPSAQYLRDRTMYGSMRMGMSFILRPICFSCTILIFPGALIPNKKKFICKFNAHPLMRAAIKT